MHLVPSRFQFLHFRMNIERLSEDKIKIYVDTWAKELIVSLSFLLLIPVWIYARPVPFNGFWNHVLIYGGCLLFIIMTLIMYPEKRYAVLSKKKNTASVIRKGLWFPRTVYRYDLTCACEVTVEVNKKYRRVCIRDNSGFLFPLSRSFYREDIVDNKVVEDIANFLGLSLRM